MASSTKLTKKSTPKPKTVKKVAKPAAPKKVIKAKITPKKLASKKTVKKVKAVEQPLKPEIVKKESTLKTSTVKTSKIKSIDNKRLNIAMLAGISILILGFSGYVWWSKVYTSPTRVFWGMVSNNLATRGLTRTVSQTQNGAKSVRRAEISLGNPINTHDYATIESSDGSVTSETINVAENGYIKYNSIKTTRKTAGGKEKDYSPALNKWASTHEDIKTEGGLSAADQSELSIASTLLGDGMLYGDLTANQRNDLVDKLKKANVYNVKTTDPKSESWNGHEVYKYDVEVSLLQQTRVIIDYLKQVGLPKAAKYIEAKGIPGGEPAQLKFVVDIATRQLLQMGPVDEAATDARVIFSQFGVYNKNEIPKQFIKSSELEALLVD